MALAAISGLQPALAQQRPPVYAQRFDDDCGLATLRMLLQRAGQDVSDEELFAAVSPSTDVDALSSRDLQRVVAALGLGYSLDIGYTDAVTATELTEFEAFMVLIKPTAMIGLSTINHFVLVEGATETGWLVADPILAERVIFPKADIEGKLVGREVGGTSFPMILRLIKDAEGAAVPIGMNPDDNSRLTWEAAYNQPRPLQKGKTVINFGVSVDRIETHPGFGLSETIVGQRVSFGVQHGISARTTARLNLSYTDTNVTVSASGQSISFGLDGFAALSLGLDYVPDLDLPEAFALSTSAEINWFEGASSGSFEAGAQVSYVHQDWTFGLNVDAVLDGGLYGQITPSVSYATDFSDVFFDISLSAPTDVETGDWSLSADAGITKLVNDDLSLRFSGGLAGRPGSDAVEASLAMQVVYAIPRRFRRAN